METYLTLSHWGQFEMQAAGTENFKEQIAPMSCFLSKKHRDEYLASKPTSFFVSRQDKPEDPKKHPFY